MAKERQKSQTDHVLTTWLGVLFIAMALLISPDNSDIFTANHFLYKTYLAAIVLSGLGLWQVSITAKLIVKPEFNTLKLVLIALLALGFLSIFWSVNPEFSLGKWLLWACVGLILWLSTRLKHQQDTFVVLSIYLSISASLIAIIGLLQFFEILTFIKQTVAPASTFVNKNIAAHTLLMLLPAPFFLLSINFKKTWKNALAPISIALIFALIFHIQSRASWLALLFVLALIMLYSWLNRAQLASLFSHQKHNKPALFFALILLLVLINTSAQGWTPFTKTWLATAGNMYQFSTNPEQFSTTGRYQIWSSALQMMSQSPFFGTGLASFSQNIANEGFGTLSLLDTQRVHNDLLEIGVELGGVGLLLILILLSILLIKFIQSFKFQNNATNPVQHWFYFLLFMGLISGFISALLSYPYQTIVPLLLLGLYLGLIMQQNKPKTKTKVKANYKISPVIKPIFIVTFSTFLIANIMLNQSWINFYQQINSYLVKLQNNNPNRTLTLSPITHNFYMLNALNSVAKQLDGFNHHSDALLFYKVVLSLWQNHNPALMRAANIHLKQQQYQAAIPYLKQATKHHSKGNYQAFDTLITVYHQLGNTAQAKAQHQQFSAQPEVLLALMPQSYYNLHQRAVLLNYPAKKVAQYYKKYQKYHGKNADLASDTAALYLRANNLDAATPYAKQVLEISPKHANAKYFRTLIKQ